MVKISSVAITLPKIVKISAILLVSAPVLILVWVFALKSLGYEFDKSYLNYSQKSCLENIDPGPRGVEGCVFWSREGYLEKKEDWRSQFKEKENLLYNQCVEEAKNPCPNKYINLNPCGGEAYRCNSVPFYEGFKHKKRQDNWSYLVSGEKDEFYYSCLNNLCPNWSLFNLFK